jgi:NAD+ synthase (glutamine-hydrolysing)
MKIALAQVNTTVGDLSGNVERCLSAAASAADQHPDLIVFPEMAVPGYPPRDMLYDESFVQATGDATRALAAQTADLPLILVGSLAESGQPTPNHPGLYNAAWLLERGAARLVAAKRLLPAYDVFHEPRWFTPGPCLPPLELAGHKIGVLVCEDLWDEGYPLHPAAELLAAGAQALVCLSASPYRRDSLAQRLYHARRAKAPLVYVNLVGATDELIFDGRSFAIDLGGNLLSQLGGFDEDLRVVDLAASPGADSPSPAPVEEEIYRALTLGVRDFARKNGLRHAYIGLSGGVDSSLVAALAADALGPLRVTGIAIPSRYTDPRSTESARELAKALGIRFEAVELEKMHLAAEETLAGLLEAGNTAENIQARLRALVLMSYVNRGGGFLLNTSNKTELSLGYSTLYGDMAGTLSPLGDLTKPEVYALAHWRNARSPIFPDFVLTRPPSAELRPGQVDPFDYGEISPEMEDLVRQNRSDGYLRRSEHKRWQIGVILKVSEKAFGTGRLIPITRK